MDAKASVQHRTSQTYLTVSLPYVYTSTRASEQANLFKKGSPALNWNYLLGYSGIVVNALAKIPLSATDIVLVTRDVLAQCDAIDGVVDNIIDIPARCDYRPENLLCNSTAGNSTATACLTQEKVDFIHLLFSPVYGTEGQLLTYGLDPGATGSLGAAASNGSENGGAFFLVSNPPFA